MLNKHQFVAFVVEGEALMKEKSLSRKDVCEMLACKYKTPCTTLYRRWFRHMTQKNETENKRGPKFSSPTKRTLGSIEEAALVTLLKSAGLTNHAITKDDLLAYVDRIRNNKSDKYMWNKHNWFSSFMKRNKATLKLTKAKVISTGRVADTTESSCEQFIETMNEMRKEFDMTESNVCNVD